MSIAKNNIYCKWNRLQERYTYSDSLKVLLDKLNLRNTLLLNRNSTCITSSLRYKTGLFRSNINPPHQVLDECCYYNCRNPPRNWNLFLLDDRVCVCTLSNYKVVAVCNMYMYIHAFTGIAAMRLWMVTWFIAAINFEVFWYFYMPQIYKFVIWIYEVGVYISAICRCQPWIGGLE